MGDVAASAEARESAEAEGARLRLARDRICMAMEPLLASWQTLAGCAWLAGRITHRLGGYYAGAAIARVTARQHAAGCGVPRGGRPG